MGEKMKLAVAQMKPTLGNVEKNIEIMKERILTAINEGRELIVFPELALSGYLLEEMVFDVCVNVPEELIELSKKISILFGGVEKGKDNYIYNSAFYLEDGEVKHIHRKVYLPTYGMFFEARYFKSGDRFRAFDTKFGRIGILICEDAWHQSSSYILSQDGADYIFCLMNNPARGFEDEGHYASKEWKAIGYLTSSMTGSYFIMANRVGCEDGVIFGGESQIVSPLGTVVAKAPCLKEHLLMADLSERDIRKARFAAPILKTENLDLTLRELQRIREEKYR
jgi:predicted amidohydrolase